MAMYNETYHCPSKKTHAACSKVLAEELGMRIVKTIDNGDCFFDTLSKYGRAHHYAPLDQTPPRLRQILIDYMEENIDDIAPYIIVKKGKTVASMIALLRKDGVWNNDMGDLLSQIASDAFHVSIFIYDVDPPEIRRIRANQIPYQEGPIHMLRINDGHYQLLMPQENASASASAAASSANKTSKKSHSVNNLSHALSKVAISKNHTHKNHGNHGNHGNHKNQQLLKNSQDLQDYEKITVVRLHKVLRSFGILEEDIQMSILSLPKKEQKTAYYDQYVSLLS